MISAIDIEHMREDAPDTGDGAPEAAEKICEACNGRGVILRSPGLHGGCPSPCPECLAHARRG